MKKLFTILSLLFTIHAMGQIKTIKVQGAVSKRYVDSVVANSQTDYQTQTAAGSTSLTFTSVPAAYKDYDIIVNGATLTPITHYTTVGNVITIPGLFPDYLVVFKRKK